VNEQLRLVEDEEELYPLPWHVSRERVVWIALLAWELRDWVGARRGAG
jgi:hypothetical protein